MFKTLEGIQAFKNQFKRSSSDHDSYQDIKLFIVVQSEEREYEALHIYRASGENPADLDPFVHPDQVAHNIANALSSEEEEGPLF